MEQLAQGLVVQPGGGGSAQTITGPLVGITKLTDLITLGTSFLYPFAGVILLFVMIWGGYDYLISRGDPEKIKSGQAKIGAGIIGFALLMLSYFIAQIFGFIFGVGEGLI